MKSASASRAEKTLTFLQEAQRNGSPVPIPGAREMRASAPAAPLSLGLVARPTNTESIAAAPGRARLEYEREGGGAPSQRAGRRRGTLRGRVRQSFLHPTQISAIWRRFPRTR
jgi:hypothetical protein